MGPTATEDMSSAYALLVGEGEDRVLCSNQQVTKDDNKRIDKGHPWMMPHDGLYTLV